MESKLIKAVEKHKAIYKRTSSEFKCKKTRDLAWLAVSRAVGQPEEYCRVRWKSLRDRFVREHAKMSTESGGVTDSSLCTWEFYEPLMFIEDEIMTRGGNKFLSSCCTRYSRIEKILISAVKNYEFLYNSNHNLFRNRLERQRAWSKVAQRVGRSPDQCRKGWRSVRERYITKKSYGQCEHADLMDFMNEHTDNFIDSEVEQYAWPKQESSEEHLDDHAYAADTPLDTSAQDSPTVESEDEYLYDINEPKTSFTKVFIENDEANEPTHSNTLALKKRKVLDAHEKFEALVGTLNDFVKTRIEKESVKSRNHEFYKVLDRYLRKMSEEEQDKMKADILMMVLSTLK